MRNLGLLAFALAACAADPEPELSEVESGLMQCSGCSAATSCSTKCTDSEGFTDFCASYTCSSADPCSDTASVALEAQRKLSPAWTCGSTIYSLSINGVTGSYRQCDQGRLVWSQNTCAQRMPTGGIYTRYWGSSTVRSTVGFPTNGAASSVQRFQHGYLATNAANVTSIVGGTTVPAAERGALMNKFAQSIAGKFPAHDTVWQPGVGAYFTTYPYLGYDKTFVVKAGTSTAYVVQGEVQNKYVAMGQWNSWLGFPTSDERCLDDPCRYRYSNFEWGHIRWSAGADRAVVAKEIEGAVPATPRDVVFDDWLGKLTFTFRLSQSIQAGAGDQDSDQDGLDDDVEKQLAFLAAPRIFWDEGEECSENQDFIKFRRLDMVQVRPRSPRVSRWEPSQGPKWITLRFMMAYPYQCSSDHTGDSEMYEVRLFSTGNNFDEWRIAEFVFTPHGGHPDDDAWNDPYYQYYGDVNTLARRAQLLGTTATWIAADENKHGTWGGSEIDSEECKGGGILGHDCFDGDLQDALAAGRYWWFDPSRDIGEPEALRYDAWPLEARGVSPAVVPQIKREPNNLQAAYIENNVGYGIAREYIRYREPGPELVTAKTFCGWHCPVRLSNGYCAGYPYNGYAEGDEPANCDGGGSTYPNTDFTTSKYGLLYLPGESFYHSGPVTEEPSYHEADFTYQLWGNPSIKPLTSGNVANEWYFDATLRVWRNRATAVATSQWSASYPVAAINDGDRKGHGWGIGGGWSSSAIPTPSAPQSVLINFGAPREIKRVEIFTVQNTYDVPVEPTATTLAGTYGIRDYQVQVCTVATCDVASDANWNTVETVTANTSAWRTHAFYPTTTTMIRVRVTAAAGSYARITEIEAWE